MVTKKVLVFLALVGCGVPDSVPTDAPETPAGVPTVSEVLPVIQVPETVIYATPLPDAGTVPPYDAGDSCGNACHGPHHHRCDQ